MGRLIMAYWDCPYCGNQGNKGSLQQCPSCGRARGDVKFYMKDNMQDATLEEDERDGIEYVDEAEAEKISRNPDWYCSFCNSLNHDDAELCSTCGASRKDSEMNYFDMRRREEEKNAQKAQPVAEPVKKSKRPFLVIAIVILAIIGLIGWMNSDVTAGWTVTGTSWERVIQIEENTLCHESDWALPAEATQTGTRNEIFSYQTVIDGYRQEPVQRSRQVLDHYETYYTYQDNGNGYFEEIAHQRPVYETEYYTEYVSVPVTHQEPVYRTKYYYDIWRWKPVREVRAGSDDHTPVWPEFTLGENEREGEHGERYLITVRETGKDDSKSQTKTWRMQENEWNQYDVGATVRITARRSGGNANITDENGNPLATLYELR